MVNERNYTTTVKCITATGVLYTAKADKFINQIGKDDKAWKMILSMNVKKDIETKFKIKNAALSLKKKFDQLDEPKPTQVKQHDEDDQKKGGRNLSNQGSLEVKSSA